MSLQVDTDTLLRLISRLKSRGGTQDISEVITSAIELWLREQSRVAKGCDPASLRGYQWKSLFLPEDQQFKMAHRLRLELARTPPPAHCAASAPAAPDLLALLTAVLLPTPAALAAPVPPAPPAAAPRDPAPATGWTLPERRKYRFRLEDVAFE
jgi:hypothetical protein